MWIFYIILCIVLLLALILFLCLTVKIIYRKESAKYLWALVPCLIVFGYLSYGAIIPGSENKFKYGHIEGSQKTPSNLAKLFKRQTLDAENKNKKQSGAILLSASSTEGSPTLDISKGNNYIKQIWKAPNGGTILYSITLPPEKALSLATSEDVTLSPLPFQLRIFRDPGLNPNAIKKLQEYSKTPDPKK